MAKGFKCPNCSAQKGENRGSHLYCPECEAVSWDLNNSVFENGRGKGNKCHHCGKSTLHNITDIGTDSHLIKVYRCSTCHAVLLTKN